VRPNVRVMDYTSTGIYQFVDNEQPTCLGAEIGSKSLQW
jgi:hypothetical protein